MVHSTRSKQEYNISEAILKGLAYDGGLFIFDEIKNIDMSNLYGKNYQEVAFEIFRLYLTDFKDEEIKWAIDNSYNKDYSSIESLTDTIFFDEPDNITIKK